MLRHAHLQNQRPVPVYHRTKNVTLFFQITSLRSRVVVYVLSL
jgi:hypothetical protein